MYKQWLDAVDKNLQKYKPGIRVTDIDQKALSDAFQAAMTPYEFATQDILPLTSAPTSSISAAKRGTNWKALGAFAASVVLSLIVGLGKYHVVQSKDGTTLVPKPHFTFAETFISMEAITGQPFITARAKYPIAVKSLQEAGLLETDTQFKERVSREIDEEMTRNSREQADQIARDLVVANERRRYDRMTSWIEGEVTNNGSKPYNLVSVRFNLFDGNGNIIDDASATKLGLLRPGETWRFVAPILEARGVQGFNLDNVHGIPE